MRFSNDVIIERPVSEVFRYLADFGNVPRWNYAIDATQKVTDGPVGVGSRFRQVRSLPKRSEEEFEVVAYDQDARLAIHGDIGPFTGQLDYELVGVAEGTKVVNRVELEARGLARAIAPLATGQIRNAVAGNLGVLKSLLEDGDAANDR